MHTHLPRGLRHARRPRLALVTGALLLLAACGGGGGGGTPPPPSGPQTIDIPAAPIASGWGANNGGSGVLQPNSDPLFVGDVGLSSFEVRAIVSFSTSAIPATASVTAAQLRIVQSVVEGTPYSDFLSLPVDSVDIGDTLDFADLYAPSITSVGGLTPFSLTLETKTVDVLAAVLADRIAGRPTTSLRLRFEGSPSTDGANDRAGFALPQGDPSQLPVLRVTYQP